MECGVACFKPRALQCCANMAAFVAFYCPPALLTSALIMYIASQITTLEKYFGFSSAQSGFLLSCNDIGFLLSTLIVSFFARKVHIPRALSISTILYGVAGFVCTLAYFALPRHKLIELDNQPITMEANDTMSTTYRPNTKSFSQMCSDIPNTNKSMSECSTGTDHKVGAPTQYTTSALVIVAIGMVLQGVGKAPRQPYIVTYIDDNVDKQKTSWFLGVITGIGIFGPALGFGLGAIFNNVFITLEDVSIGIYDVRWFGAWWLGFLFFGVLAVISAFPLCCFPRRLRQKSEREAKAKESGKHKLPVKEFLSSVLRIISNPIYMCQLIATCIVLFLIGGFISFTPKYLETQFSIPPWKANVLMGSMSVLSASIGSIVGGGLVSYLKMSPYACIRFIFIMNIVTTVFPVTMLFLGCPTPDIIGFNVEKINNNSSSSSCSFGCNCDMTDYFPVCGSDGNNYFSPCHAGCTKTDIMTFRDCRCIDGMNGTATSGLCPTECNMLWPYMIMSFIGSFLMTLCILPGMIFQIRSVSDKDKAMAVAVSSFLSTLLGWMPGPVVTGKIVDSCCKMWGSSCYGKGACTLYDNYDFRFLRHIVEIAAKVVVITLYFVTMMLAKRKTDWSTGDRVYDKDITNEEGDELMNIKTDRKDAIENGHLEKK
ncbi:hypothetical protein FSP39_006020 [Pinctada imbricata]|uniref:Solute carrier organic anion transporter family member n=1 Tax=Pinctada imbricata TaxID=66713 RepID=A0AA89BN06_PINIB|nr:hypothetical protein FSP39_006020 [Pinctada imbricata]